MQDFDYSQKVRKLDEVIKVDDMVPGMSDECANIFGDTNKIFEDYLI